MARRTDIRIPSRLKLLGCTVTVEQIPPIQWKRKDCIGYFDPNEMRIEVRKGHKDLRGHTFLHELTHAILGAMNHELEDDEVFVDTFSGLLHQALSTAEYK